MGNGSSLLLMLRGHLLPRFGGARGTWELVLLSTTILTHMYVGLEDLRHHIREKQYTQTIYPKQKKVTNAILSQRTERPHHWRVEVSSSRQVLEHIFQWS